MSLASSPAIGLPGGLGQPDRHELAGMIPFVGGRRQVHAVVALQPHQPAPQARGQHLGDLGLAGAGLALQEQRPAHRQRQMHRGRQFLVGDVALVGEQLGGVGDGRRQSGHYSMLPRIRISMNR